MLSDMESMERPKLGFAPWFRALLAREGLAQHEAAWALNVSPSTVSHWLSQRGKLPDYESLVAIAQVFGELPPDLDTGCCGRGRPAGSGGRAWGPYTGAGTYGSGGARGPHPRLVPRTVDRLTGSAEPEPDPTGTSG